MRTQPVRGARDVTTVRVAADGCDITQAERDRAELISRRWPRFDPATMGASFVFRMEGRMCAVEAIVSRKRRDAVVAKGRGADFRTALHELDEHVRKILKRDREKRKEVRP